MLSVSHRARETGKKMSPVPHTAMPGTVRARSAGSMRTVWALSYARMNRARACVRSRLVRCVAM